MPPPSATISPRKTARTAPSRSALTHCPPGAAPDPEGADLHCFGAVVDELGRLKAQIAGLQEMEKELRDRLVEAGIDEAEGELFRATVARTEFEKTDWRAVVEAQKSSPTLSRLINQNTTTEKRTTVKVSSRSAAPK